MWKRASHCTTQAANRVRALSALAFLVAAAVLIALLLSTVLPGCGESPALLVGLEPVDGCGDVCAQ